MTSKSKFFGIEHLKQDLKGRAVRSGAVTMVSQAVQFVLQMGSTMILARLLTPGDFGLVSMVVAVTNFAALFKDLGLSMATIQKAEINHGQVSSLFWVNFGISLLTTVVIAAAAPLIADFYQEPRLFLITLVLSSTFLLGGLAVQHQALLRRQMQFKRLAIVRIVSYLAGVLAAVVLAWVWRDTDHAYMALIWMQVVRELVLVLGLWVFCPWVPGIPVRGSGVRSMLSYGADVTGFSLMNYWARNLDRILIGKFCGSAPLGFYAKAYQFLIFPINQLRAPIFSVATPVLSSLQNDGDGYRRYMHRLMSILAFFTMPVMAYAFVYVHHLVQVLLGSQWGEAVPIFRVLAFAAFIQPVASTRGLAMLTLGFSRRYLMYGVFWSVCLILSLIIGVQWKTVGVAMAYTIAQYLFLFPTLYYCFRGTPLSVGLFMRAISRPFISSLTLAVILTATLRFFEQMSSVFLIIPISLVFSVSVYLLVFVLLPYGKDELAEYMGYLRLFRRKDVVVK